MNSLPEAGVRIGQLADAETIGQLLHDFNREFDEPTPGPERLAERVRELLNEEHITVLLAGRHRTVSQSSVFARRSGPRRSSATWRSCTWSRVDAAAAWDGR